LGRTIERLICERAGSGGLAPSPELARAIEVLPAAVRAKLAAWRVLDSARAAASQPLSDLFDEWSASLTARDVSARHVERVARRARALAGACGFLRLSDVRPEAVERHLARSGKAIPRPSSATSARSVLPSR
jgi:hypothetical protein